ncbi:MAG: tetratricopeptide repeat protein, partial [Anaerolineaceae bacterium]
MASFVAPYIQDRISEEMPGEYRPTWWAFVRVPGCHDDFAIVEGEQRSLKLTDVATAVVAAAREFGLCLIGSDFDPVGVRFMLSAGSPHAAPDPGERLVCAALRLQEAVGPGRLQIAIADGRVYAGEVGTASRRIYSVVGGPINLAARLLGLAKPGDTVAAGATVEAMRERPATRALAPARLKGMRERQRAYVVLSFEERARPDSNDGFPFVGRESQLRTMQSSLAERGSTLTELRGVSGIGKSRLMAEFCRLASIRAHKTECLPYEHSTAYACFRRLCRRVLDIPASADSATAGVLLKRALEGEHDLLPWLPFLARVVDADVQDTPESDAVVSSFRVQKLHEAVLLFFDARFPGAALFCFEDLQWVDEASAELLQFLLEHSEGRSWKFYLTRRLDPAGWRVSEERLGIPVSTILLSPLAPTEAATLAGFAAEERPLPTDTLHAIAEHSGGNPLYVLELVEAAQHTGALPRNLPIDIENIASGAIDQLASNDRQLLRDASVFGQRFRIEALHSVLTVLDPQRTANVLAWTPPQDCARAVAPGEFEFRHVILRDAAYNGLSRRRRKALHRAIGEALESQLAGASDVLDALVLHFSEAGDSDRTWRYARRAADNALDKDAPAEAAKHLQVALEAAVQAKNVAEGEVLATLEKLADAQVRAGRFPAASSALLQATALTQSDTTTKARLLRKLGETHERRAQWDAAIGVYESAISMLPKASRQRAVLEQRAEICIAYAGVRLRQGDQQDCVVWSKKAMTLAAAAHSLPVKAHAYCLLHAALTHLSPREAERYRGLALSLVEQLPDPVLAARIFNNVGYELHYVKGLWDEGLAYYRRSLEIRTRIGDTIGRAMVSNNIAEILLDQGLYAEAEAMFRESLWASRAAGYPLGVALMRRNLGVLKLRQLKLGEALPMLTSALTELGNLHADERNILVTRARLAEYHIASGDWSSARAETDSVRTSLRRDNRYPGAEADLLRLEGLAALQQGNPFL